MRQFLASLVVLAAAAFVPAASAGSTPHFRASHQNGGMHFRASHGHQSQSVIVGHSRCGPTVVTTWQPQHRLYRSGFVHFSQPTIVSAPGIIPSSRGWRGSCGGFYHGQVAPLHAGSLCGYNGSVGSDNANRRQVDFDKRSRVHSPKLSKSRDD